MPIAAGRLRHRIRIERDEPVRDSSGEVVQDPITGEIAREWVVQARAWAEIRPMSVKEFIQSAALQSQVTTRITMRWREIEPTDRVVHERLVRGVRADVIYDLHGALDDPDAGIEYVTLAAAKGVNEG